MGLFFVLYKKIFFTQDDGRRNVPLSIHRLTTLVGYLLQAGQLPAFSEVARPGRGQHRRLQPPRRRLFGPCAAHPPPSPGCPCRA